MLKKIPAFAGTYVDLVFRPNKFSTKAIPASG
jgi:hypothetical protein